MRILQKRNSIIVSALFALIVLYHATPFSGTINWLRRPLVWAGTPLYAVSRVVAGWGNGVFRGYALTQRVARDEQIIANLTHAQATATAPTPASVPGIDDVTVGARVVAVNVIGSTRMLLIDAGSNSGIVAGTAAATPQGVFVGKIARVFKNFSLILPATSDASAVAAQASRNRDIQAVVRGKGGMGFSMELISQDADIREGDIVVTSLLEENTPVGLLLGTVTAVAYTQGQLFKEATLAPFIPISDITSVRVFIPQGE